MLTLYRPVSTGSCKEGVKQIEEGIPWKQAERDTLRKWFLAFGFDRWEDVRHLFIKKQLLTNCFPCRSGRGGRAGDTEDKPPHTGRNGDGLLGIAGRGGRWIGWRREDVSFAQARRRPSSNAVQNTRNPLVQSPEGDNTWLLTGTE